MKYFLFIDTWLLNQIDFSEVMETNRDTLRFSNDEGKTYVKWIGETPPSVQAILDNHPYSINTLEEAIEILKSDEWVDLSECDGCPCTQYYKSEGMEI